MRDLLYVVPGRPEPSGAIGLLMPEFGNPVFASLAQAMETRATAAGFATIICNTAGSAMREVDYVHMLLERRVEGMVFICAEITDVRGEHSHYGQLLEQGARLVFVNGTRSPFRSHPSASTSARPGEWRPSTCWSWVIGGSASSPGRPLPSRRVKRTVAGRRRCRPPGSTPGHTSPMRDSRSTEAGAPCDRSWSGRTATAPPR